MPRTRVPKIKSKRTRRPMSKPWIMQLISNDPKRKEFTTMEKAERYVKQLILPFQRGTARLRVSTKSKKVWKGHGYKIIIRRDGKAGKVKESPVVATIRPWGGYLMHPPETCDYKRHCQGVNWTDLGNCMKSCEVRCEKYLRWSKMSSKERQTYLRSEGVILP